MPIRYLSGISVDSTVLVVDAANDRVGIGTASPAYKFEVSNGTITGTMNPNSSGFMFIGSTTNHPLYFGVYDATRMMISTAGNVGIGTTAPTDKLHVYGGRIVIDNTLANQSGIQFNQAGTEMAVLYRPGGISNQLRLFVSGAGDVMTWNSSGNVGIGTTSPTKKLDVTGDGLFSSSGSGDTFTIAHSSGSGIGIKITKGGNGEGLYVDKTSGNGNAVTIIGTLNATTLVKSGGTSSQYLMADGSVSTLTNPVTGTGTTNFVPKWTSASAIGDSVISDTSGVVLIGGSVNVNGENTHIGIDATGGAGRVGFVKKSGLQPFLAFASDPFLIAVSNSTTIAATNTFSTVLSIATSGAATFSSSVTATQGIFSGGGRVLQVTSSNDAVPAVIRCNAGNVSTLSFQVTTSTNDFNTRIGCDVNDFIAYTANTERMRITSAGNVGIGTTSPVGKLSILVDGGTTWTQYLSTPSVVNKRNSIGFHDSAGANIAAILTDINSDNTADFGISVPNGSPRLVIKASGNVGIGTTAPIGPLEVYRSASGTLGGHIIVNNNGTAVGNETALMFGDGGINGIRAAISCTTEGAPYTGELRFKSGVTAYSGLGTNMVIKGNGNVLIGTTTDSGFKLDVSGTGRFTGSGSTSALTINNPTSNPQNYIDFTAGATLISRLARGNGSSGMEVNGLNIDNFSGFQIRVNQLGGSGGTINLMGGNVGIGTTAPGAKLNVTDGFIRVNGTDTDQYFFEGVRTGVSTTLRIYDNSSIPFYDSHSSMVFRANQNGGSGGYIGLQGGNVGIGTTNPLTQLHVANTIRVGVGFGDAATAIFGDSGTPYWSIGRPASSGNFRISSYALNALEILPTSGFVGIGTTAPVTKLEVYGGHNDTTARLYSTGNNAGLDASLDMWASEPGVTFDGSGIGNNVNGHPFYGRRNAGLPQSYIRFYDGGILLNTGSTTASQAVTVLASGNVGIGTNSPSAKLDVSAGAGTPAFNNGIAILTGNSTFTTGHGGILQFQNEDVITAGVRGIREAGGWEGGLLFYTHTSSAGNTFNSTFTEKMRINGAGNVGIGTTAPTTKLDVAGTLGFTAGAASAIIRRTTVNGSNGISIQGNANDTVSDTNAGASIFVGGGIIGDTFEGNIVLTAYGSIVDTNRNSIRFSNRSGVNTIAERMRINHLGEVGIGTTAPTQLLHILGTNAANNGLTIQNTNASGNSQVRFLNTSGTERAAITYVNSVDAVYFYLASAGNILNLVGSNVGIGTTSPSYTLDVTGSARVNSTSNLAMFIKTSSGFGAGISYEDSTTGGNDVVHAGAIGDAFYITTGYSERMRITSAGNVGIGTTAPSARLHVSGGDGIINNAFIGVIPAYGANYTEFSHTSRSDAGKYSFLSGSAGDTYVNSANGQPIYFRHENNDFGLFTSDGKLGIGTTAPSEKLHVDGSTLVTYNNSFQSTNSVGNKAILARVSPTSGIINYAEYATAANLNGFVIGSDDARVKGNITGDSLEFITNTSTRMTILSSGNVGINTTTPGSTLHVIGDVLIQTGSLGVGVNPNATDGRIDASNDIVAFSTSDRRLKENITPITNALEKVRSLTGVEFDWKEETKSVHGYEGHDVGVIAQDVQAVLPEAVRTNDSGYLSVRYEKMIALLVEGMKEQQLQIDELKKLIK